MSARREVRGWVSDPWDWRWENEADPDLLPSDYVIVAQSEWDEDVTPQKVVLMHADEHAALLAEVERLRAGGCARDQRLTQHCAEAEALRREVQGYRVLLDEAATDLEEVAEGYQDVPDSERRPSEKRRYENDMELPRRIRAALSDAPKHTPDPVTDAPGHTDLMLSPEALEAYLKAEDAATDADLADFYRDAQITEVDDD